MNMDLSEELVRMAEHYCAVRAALETDDPLFGGHHPMMKDGHSNMAPNWIGTMTVS
jgi:hypothetical protein